MRNDDTLLSGGEAVADPSAQLLDSSIGRALRREEPVKRMIEVVVYRRKAEAAGEAIVRTAQEAIAELGAERAVRFTAHTWVPWAILPFLKGARRHPILEIEGRVYSEGTVPDKEMLKRHLRTLLT
ncbi:MAG: hypothetical protein Q8Q39_05620 [bacterium]|nr:hypothetical protein [bacterium]